VARTSADLTAVGLVESDSPPLPLPEAATPGSDWFTVTYRLDPILGPNVMDCTGQIQVAKQVEHGAKLTTQDAPIPHTRVLLFVRPGVSGSYHYLTYATPPVEVAADASIYRVDRDPASPPTTTAAPPTDQPTLHAEVALGDPSRPFLTVGPHTEFPARLTLINTTDKTINVTDLGPSQWHVTLKDVNGNVWTSTTPVQTTDFPPALVPGEQLRFDLITRPDGQSPLKDGIYALDASLNTAGDPITTDSKITIAVRCVVCK
jgi:hypothetical protein